MPIILDTPRLRLREFVPGDADALRELGGQEHVVRRLPKWQTTGEECATWIGWMRLHYKHPAKPPRVALAVTLGENGRLIGLVGVGPREDMEGQPEITGFIHEEYLRQGYGAEAADAFCAWALGTLGLPWIMGLAEPSDHAAAALFRRCGFENQGPRQVPGPGGVQIRTCFRRYPGRG